MKIFTKKEQWQKADNLEGLNAAILSMDADVFADNKKAAKILLKAADIVSLGKSSELDVESFYDIFQGRLDINSSDYNKEIFLNNNKRKTALDVIANGQYDNQQGLDAAYKFNNSFIDALHDYGVGHENGEMLVLFRDNFKSAFENSDNSPILGVPLFQYIQKCNKLPQATFAQEVQHESYNDDINSQRFKWEGYKNVGGTSLRIIPPPAESAQERLDQNRGYYQGR